MNAADFRALKTPLIVLALVAAIGAGLAYYSHAALVQTRVDLAAQLVRQSDARVRLQKSGDEKDLIVRHLRSYEFLQQLGFAGEEQRINWLDGLRLSNQQAQLFGIDYQIGAQQSYPYASELDPGQLTMHQSLMKINLGLLHEGDLTRFLGTLAKQSAGVFAVNQCMIDRVNAGGGMRFQSNLRAECELAWITIRPAAPADKKS